MKSPSMIIGSCSISSPIVIPLTPRDEDPLLVANKLPFKDLFEVFPFPLAVNPM